MGKGVTAKGLPGPAFDGKGTQSGEARGIQGWWELDPSRPSSPPHTPHPGRDSVSEQAHSAIVSDL